MKFAQITNKKISNLIIASKEFGESISAIYCGDLPVQIGDGYKNGVFTCTRTEYDEEGQPVEKTYTYDVPEYPEPPAPPTPEPTELEVLEERVDELTATNEELFSTLEMILLEIVPTL